MRWGFYLAACAATALAATAYAANVQISLATNASFAIYAGAADGTNLALQSTGNLPASAGTPTPGKFSFEMEDDSYLYIVAWGDPRLARGLLAEFVFNGLVVLGGDPAWEVCPATLDVTDGPPSPSAVAVCIRQANRRFAWVQAASLQLNRSDGAAAVAEISGDAAWMWLPSGADSRAAPAGGRRDAATVADDHAVIFRIAPNKLWPEYDLSYARNAGRGSLSAPAGGSNSGYPSGGGGGGGGSSGSGLPQTGGLALAFPHPSLSSDPANSSAVPARAAAQEPGSSVLTPPPATSPSSPAPPLSDQTGSPKPPPPAPPPVPPPPVPEPATGALLLVAGAALRRRRGAALRQGTRPQGSILGFGFRRR